MAQREMSRTCLHAQIRSVFHRTSRAQIGVSNSTIVAFKSRFYIGRHQVLPSNRREPPSCLRLKHNGARAEPYRLPSRTGRRLTGKGHDAAGVPRRCRDSHVFKRFVVGSSVAHVKCVLVYGPDCVHDLAEEHPVLSKRLNYDYRAGLKAGWRHHG
jgi:hypothetical protein